MWLQWEMVMDGAIVCSVCACLFHLCGNLYALVSVVRQKVLEEWITRRIRWLIISLCLQHLTAHWEQRLGECGCMCAVNKNAVID